MMKVYLDHSATTCVDADVLQAMMPYFCDTFGNASSQHQYGQAALNAVDRAREQVAAAIGAKPNEIYFTSGGTESDNWAIKGIAHAKQAQGKHIITSCIEHHAVLHTCEQLAKEGFEITYLPIHPDGEVDLDALRKAIRPDTILISVMYANNEIGTIQPVDEIARIAHEHHIVFHTDAVQAMGAVHINVKEQGIDMLSMSGHKFYGPKGVGALYIRNGLRPDKLIIGGAQERSMRGGTYNTPGIVGLGEALTKTVRDMDENNAYVASLRDYFVQEVVRTIPDVVVNGGMQHRLPNNANISFKYIEGESILLSLDMEGIAASSGSACSSGSLEPSHVLLATGLPVEYAHGSIRFSFGKDNTKEQVDYTLRVLRDTVSRLRAWSPLYADHKGE